RLKAPRMAERLVEDIFAALDEQTVVVPGTEAAPQQLDQTDRGTPPGPPTYAPPAAPPSRNTV
ncbi:hypothetical protein, partial [Streptomyces sp. NPDC088748]|uniref:hypothetical protein n=1 Tax=Streptomyces sp. NPDC088748 TaxID=3365887 RepID=UPI00380B37C3